MNRDFMARPSGLPRPKNIKKLFYQARQESRATSKCKYTAAV